ncbi:SusC/RagA family TonB-linked outer membrane protein [Sphingobacterium sp. JB170]|uniref:SusC/RagA family TonB-linked outer membrane protein n=1 Tax=Sphingobacterium sp. JB170 TaxID=1434842 RepID=UPI00097EFAD3|nr:SusC/RagA family TonB-linked outer membrane protein [Sphingobacterium sp. JB170]SJN47916.1 SusC, outer membrane protein involved in starch binding [Sphingobacterium sp. JB170]
MKGLTIILASILLFCQSSFSQQITGKVIDVRNSKALQGVTINDATGRVVMITDQSGVFEVVEPGGKQIAISHVGYRDTIIQTRPNNFYLVALQPLETNIEEVSVVHTGYQELSPSQVSGSIQVLDEADLNKQTGRNVLDRINNLAPGVSFDRAAQSSVRRKLNVSIRGLSTINGYLDPLIVLDGFIYEGDIDNIDPHSIENITILKDAAASSIWGARAGNGVIVITTKRGKIGRKLGVGWSTTMTVSEKPDLSDVYQLPSSDFIDFEKLLFDNGNFNNLINRTPYYPTSPAVNIFQKLKNGEISEVDAQHEIERLKGIDARDDYTKYFIRNPVMLQSSLSLEGGNETHGFNFTGGYTTESAEYYSTYKKWNFNISERVSIGEKIDFDVRLNYTNSRATPGRPVYGNMGPTRFYPYFDLADQDGNPLPLEDTYNKGYMDAYFPDELLSWDYVPLEDYKFVDDQHRTEELYAVANVSYRIIPELAVKFGYQIQQQNANNDIIYSEQSRKARTEYNRFASYDPATGRMNYVIPKGGIRETANSKGSSYTFRGQLDFKKSLSKHMISGLIGTEVRQNKRSNETFSAYGYKEDPLSSIGVDYANTYPTPIFNRNSKISGAPAFTRTLNRFISLYGTMLYSFDERIGLTGSIRQDGANIFGAESNEKWKPLWSVGSFWNISNEEFATDYDFLDRLKLRLTYGFSGNVDLSKTPLPLAGITPNIYSDYPALVVSLLNDPSLRWEKVSTFNIGLDFSLFSGRLFGTFDMYRKNGTDLYGPSGYDYTTWGNQSRITRNVASMAGNGIDIMLTTKNIDREFKWSTTWIVSSNQNKTTDYYTPNKRDESLFLTSDAGITPVEGYLLYAIAALKWGGLNSTGDPLGYVNGELSDDYAAIRKEASDLGVDGNLTIKGASRPQLFGSLENRFSFRNFSMGFSLSFDGDYYFRKKVTSYDSFVKGGKAYSDIERRWTKSGDEKYTDVPAFVYPANSRRDLLYQMSEINVLKADHIRLAYVNIGWSPKFGVNKHISNLNIFVNASNLGLIWTANKEKIDPEYQDRIGPLKTYSVGFRANFN